MIEGLRLVIIVRNNSSQVTRTLNLVIRQGRSRPSVRRRVEVNVVPKPSKNTITIAYVRLFVGIALDDQHYLLADGIVAA